MPARHQQGPAQEPSSALGRSLAFHQRIPAERQRPASLSPAHCPPGRRARASLKLQPRPGTGVTSVLLPLPELSWPLLELETLRDQDTEGHSWGLPEEDGVTAPSRVALTA